MEIILKATEIIPLLRTFSIFENVSMEEMTDCLYTDKMTVGWEILSDVEIAQRAILIIKGSKKCTRKRFIMEQHI